MLLVATFVTGCGRATLPTDHSGDVETTAGAQASALPTEDPLDQIDRLIQAGETNEALARLRHLLLTQPNDAGVVFRLASLLANSGNLAQAVDLLSTIPVSHPDAGLPAIGQSADWCFQLERYDEAEQKYQQLLKFAPDAVLAHRQLAYLYNRQGRRHEAAEHVRTLCRLGDVRQDELHSLVILSDAMYDDPEQPVADDSLPYWPIGASGQARYLLNQQRYVEALERLQPEISKSKVRPAVSALYGRLLIEAQDDQGFRAWVLQSTDAVKQFSDYWAALGTYLLAECRFEESAKSFGEAIDRDPTDLISMGRLRQALLALGQDSLAKQWEERWRQTREILRVNNRVSVAKPPNPDLISDLAIRLHDLGYELQAILWKSIEAALRGLPSEVQRQLNAERERLLKINDAFPDQNERLCGMDLQQYPWPDVKRIQSGDPQSLGDQQPVAYSQDHQQTAPVTARFVNVAENVGLNHCFSVATSSQESGFAIYQILGAAIAVLDYDLDGAPDFYLGQGAADPPLFRSQLSNSFYRNVQHKLVDVTVASNTSDFGYSTGITSGDWNQDGFQDLVVANLGSDVLLLNNGDGSFQSRSLFADQSLTRVPTSMAIADVTGDHLPDLFQAAYIDDVQIAKRPARNDEGLVISSLVPTDFKPGKDRLIVNGVDGTPAPQSWDPDERHTAAGLGVVVANFDDRAGNEIFIGNDLYANQLWKRDVTTGAWSEVALPLGCAYGFTGNATASMGIATGDYDGNGYLDLHITNFQDDASSLFLLDNGVYRDRNQQFQIGAISRSVLGFGTQSIDFDNDGLLDLVVANGHVEDEAQSSAPFKQLPQLFRNMSGRFELVEVTDPSGYWSSKHLGRGLARIDFNRDGKLDFIATHLEAPTGLLINQTDSQNHWLQLQLVGTQSERDAIGARVHVRVGNKSAFHWVTAGDGYLSRNELMLPIGLGQATQVEEVTIQWPSGIKQTIRNVPIDRRLLIIENQADPVSL